MAKSQDIFKAPYQLRQDYSSHGSDQLARAAHHLFQQRMEPRNFHSGYLSYAARMLTRAIRINPGDNTLLFELALILLQNQPGESGILKAYDLISQVTEQSIHHSNDVRDVMNLCLAMMNRTPGESGPFVIKRVNWAVSNRCPMLCRGCYNIFSVRQPYLYEALKIADKFAHHGTRFVVLSGGDPLLWPPLYKVLEHLRDLGLQVALDVTPYTLDRPKLERISKSVNLLRLPLDGSTETLQSTFRVTATRDLVARFRRTLDMCDDIGFANVVVHTVASRKNIRDLWNVAAEIAGRKCVKQWVVFQWSERRAPRRLIPAMAVDAGEIQQVISAVQRDFASLRIYFAPYEERAMANLFVQSNGIVTTFAPSWGADLIVGDILRESLAQISCRRGVDRIAIDRASSGSREQFALQDL